MDRLKTDQTVLNEEGIGTVRSVEALGTRTPDKQCEALTHLLLDQLEFRPGQLISQPSCRVPERVMATVIRVDCKENNVSGVVARQILLETTLQPQPEMILKHLLGRTCGQLRSFGGRDHAEPNWVAVAKFHQRDGSFQAPLNEPRQDRGGSLRRAAGRRRHAGGSHRHEVFALSSADRLPISSRFGQIERSVRNPERSCRPLATWGSTEHIWLTFSRRRFGGVDTAAGKI